MTLPKITITIEDDDRDDEDCDGPWKRVEWGAVLGEERYGQVLVVPRPYHGPLGVQPTEPDEFYDDQAISNAVAEITRSALASMRAATAERTPVAKHPATVEIRPNTGDFEDYTHSCDKHLAEMLGHAMRTTKPNHYMVRPLGDGDRVDGEMPGCCWR